MTVLVCGGAGYIGSHCVRMLLGQHNRVIVIDNFSMGNKEAVAKEAILYVGDIRDAQFLDYVFAHEKIDAVIHFCAKSLVGESMQDPLTYFDNNVTGTLILLQAMLRASVRKIVFSSSAAVYGEHENMPIDESFATIPTNPYGESKLMMEKLMKWADAAHGIKYVSLRYFNVAGASFAGDIGEDHRPETHLIPIVLQVALKKRDKIKVFGTDYNTPDGTCIRDYIHVIDLIDAHLRALKYLNENNTSNIFNLGSENGYSVLEIIKSVEKVTQKDIPLEIVARRLGDPARLVASSKKINQTLGWKTQYGIEEIIKSAYDFHRTHLEGYKC